MLNAIGRSDHEERIKKVAGLLRENGYSGLVIAGPTNLFYFCGAKGGYSDRLYGLVIKSDGTYFYVCPSFEERRMRETYGEDAEVLPWQEDQDPCAMIAEKLSTLEGKIGLEDTKPMEHKSMLTIPIAIRTRPHAADFWLQAAPHAKTDRWRIIWQ